jgi:hypothetical protein
VWRTDFLRRLVKRERLKLELLCQAVDELLEKHAKNMVEVNAQTASHCNLYGQKSSELPFQSYADKEKIAKEREGNDAPYFKLKAKKLRTPLLLTKPKTAVTCLMNRLEYTMCKSWLQTTASFIMSWSLWRCLR